MKEREIKDFYRMPRERNIDRTIEVGRIVSEGLELERGTPPGYTMERFQICGVIADTLIDASKCLDVEIPVLAKTYDWGDIQGQKTHNGVVALSSSDIIKYSPWYLKRIAMGYHRKGPGARIETNSLVNTTAHELFHVWQWREFPQRSETDFTMDTKWRNYAMRSSSDTSFDEIPKSKSELEARAFGNLIQRLKRS